MKNTRSPLLVLWKKELYALCISPATAVGILFFLLGTGIPFFLAASDGLDAASFTRYVVRIPFLSALVLPVLSMGIWSHERKQGTDRLLFSLPVSDRLLVAGKFCALLTVWLGMLILTLPIMLAALGMETGTAAGTSAGTSADISAGAIFSTFLLLFFYGASSLAAGQLLSVLFSLPAVSFLVTMALLLVLNTIQILPQALVLPVWAASAVLRLSFAWHLEAAARGILDSRDILFYLLPTIAALEANTVLLRHRRIHP